MILLKYPFHLYKYMFEIIRFYNRIRQTNAQGYLSRESNLGALNIYLKNYVPNQKMIDTRNFK